MPALLPILFSILSSLPGQLGAYFSKQQDLQLAQLNTQLQVELKKTELAAQIAQSEASAAHDALISTGSSFKYVTYGILMLPFIMGLLFPKYALVLFHNLSLLPDWYVQMIVVINLTIWGIRAGAPVITGIFSSMQDFLQSKREFKLEKARIDRKAFFDALRVVKGTLTQQDVDAENKALDQLEGK